MNVKISSIIENQFPSFIKEESPLMVEFIKQYFISGEYSGGPVDLITNLDTYTRLENLTKLVESTTLSSDISFSDFSIPVASTKGFSESYGLIKIDSEIITYTSKTDTSFEGCVRGFSGISNSNLQFSTSESDFHTSGAQVVNLSILFLEKFLEKLKKQLVPGFEGRELATSLNQTTFIEKSKSFYSSKGTDRSFEILFGALYGEKVEVIRPRDYLFTASAAEYRVSKDLVVEALFGDPLLLENRTLFQDKTADFDYASGSISKVEQIYRGDKTYYVISLDYDYNKDINVSGSVFGEFSIHPKTQLTSSALANATTLDVDSTVGFPNSGSLALNDGSVLTYTSKSATQFFGCSGLAVNLSAGESVAVNAFAYGYSDNTTDNLVAVRVTGVIGNFKQIENAYHLNVGDNIRIKSLGKASTNIHTKNWLYNLPISYNVSSISLLDSPTSKYRIVTYDDNLFNVGDSLNIVYKNGTIIQTTAYSKVNSTSFVVQGQGALVFSSIDYIEKQISKVNATGFSSANVYAANVQNVYEDNDENVYVAAPSIPYYFQQPLQVTSRGVSLTGTFSGTTIASTNHGFLTGDVVVYDYTGTSNNLGISKGTYYIKKITDNSFALATSRSNLKAGSYITVSGTVTNNTLSYNDFFGKTLSHQKLFRKISAVEPTSASTETPIGNIGILNNGVEILNYKTQDAVFYGQVDSIDVISPGSEYDVLNPPTIEVTDETGTGLVAECEVTGTLKEIRIIEPGLNYTSEPTITITGGNGKNAKAKAEIGLFEHSISFNSSSIVSDTIGFSTYHGFNNAEKIIYKPDGVSRVLGISTDSEYFASKVDDASIRVHRTYLDAVSGINTISLSYNGFAIHRFVAAEAKTKISSIVVVNPGEGYTNHKISVSSSGINTATNTINKNSHGFKTGERIIYQSYTGTPIVGIQTNTSYYVTAEENSFKLSPHAQVGINTSDDFYFKTGHFVNLTSAGIGTHYFNYEPIEVTVYGISGVTNLTSATFIATIQPVFRGQITSVSVVNGGQEYGQEDILNYNRQPNININSGNGAQVQAIISNGKIVQVLIINSGTGYNSPPDIIISGIGNGAKLTPIVENGQLKEVKIINPGYGYSSSDIYLTVVPAGSSAQLRTNAKQWNVDAIQRLILTNKITDDDGIITKSINSDYGLQYTHGYAPRKLRQTLSAQKYVSGNIVFQPDLRSDINGNEITSDAHSPIIGWAYDGNPIYGPYGYENKTGGAVKLIETGYELSIQSNRPSTTIYPQGFFIEDYQFTTSGDLDQHNGRYCITPEFPNGIYAYFATLSQNGYEATGPFSRYIQPAFPYFIGNSYHSKPIDFNFTYTSNQDLINLNDTGWLRNTIPFKLNSENSSYKYLLQPFNIIEQTATVTSTIPGSVEQIIVSSGGDGYKNGDRLVFDSSTSQGINASAIVNSIEGKIVNGISVATTSIFNVEFVPNPKYGIIGFSTVPHPFQNNDVISVKNLNYNKSVLQKTFTASVSSQKYTLNTDINVVALTGVTTYVNLYGSLEFPLLKENDILQIDNEQVKVLNIDKAASRLFVERAYGGTVGSYHTVGAAISEVTRKFFISANTQDFTNSFVNREIYFNPTESLGIGLGRTIAFSNSGVGQTNMFVPTRSIYIPEHGLNTGDSLTYKLNGGNQITISTNGITTSLLSDNTTVYAVKYSGDFVGLSTEKVGIGSTGNFVGYNTTSEAKILYFNVTGSGSKHSLQTTYNSTIGQVDRNIVSIFPATDSGLRVGDKINVSALPNSTKNIKVVYNSQTQRLLTNPRAFLAADVVNETIQITTHGYYTGQKIVHTSTTSTGGLVNNGIYYVVVVNSDKISLCSSYYDATLAQPNIIQLSGASFGTISEVNPSLNVVKNNSVVFDLSDSSLSVTDGFQLIPAFEFDFYNDNNFNTKFETAFSNSSFNVTKFGNIGVDSTAKVTLTYNQDVPNQLYYKLTPLRTKPIFIDSENIVNNNTVNFVDSVYSGLYNVSGVGSTSFSYTIEKTPEVNSYTSNVTYTTSSATATGSIDKVIVTSGGKNYKFLTGITSVVTDNGSGAIFEILSSSIGRINNYTINDIGFDYPADLTLTPLTQTPVVLKVVPQTSLKSIGITSQGQNYIFAPTLVLVDGLTLKQITDVDLRYELGDNEVQIVKNSRGINNVEPIIIPTNNSNAIGISSISFNSTTKDVTVVLSTSYSSLSDFPFAIGDKVLVENVSIISDSAAKGYNSSSYDYARFTITAITPNIGGSNGSIVYNLTNYLTSSQYPGIYDTSIVSGTVLPEKFFPQFSVELTKNSFLKDEIVTSGAISGRVQFWNSENELLTVSTSDEFTSGLIITGSDSLSQGRVDTIYDFKSQFNIKSTSVVRKGWQTEKGFLNNEFQRLQDSNYYQAFAYSLKSKVDYSTWNNAVSSLNHIAGFKKFSDLVVESDSLSGVGTTNTESISSITIFSDSEVDFNCVDDFDLATENNYQLDSRLGSNQIYFGSRILQDYSESIGNRVLNIDNISTNFNGTTRQFDLRSGGSDIFARTFDGSSTSTVDLTANTIQIQNHYFTNGEKVTYSYTGSPIGITTTTISGIGSTDKLPPTVYVVKYSESTFGLADTAENALKEVPVSLDFTSVGIGSTHILTATSQNTRALISLGGVLQTPVVSTAASTNATSYVGIASTVISFASIANFASGDYAKIDNEILKVVTVGVATTNDVLVQRSWAGTGVATHALNSIVYKVQGDYNIVDNIVHFVDPPRGPSPIGTTTGSPQEVDFVGITTTLDFNGRVFMRNGIKDTTNDAYATNFLFDDISSNFNGITSSFTLKSNYQNISGFATNNGAILINEVFQSPSDFFGAYKTYGSYTLEQTAGITSIRFLGDPATQTYDVNGSGLPVGGVIVSIGYTHGLGLQPIVAAGGTAVVSTAGAILSVSIGNSGSGYRSGMQTVNVGIYVSTTGISTIQNIGIASVLDGRIVSVAITNPGTGYTNTNPPLVRFDDPLPYTNLPLQYVSPSSGVGTGAKVDIGIGMASSVINLEIANKGFGYKKGDILSVSIGGTVGIPTIISASYSDFKITVDEIYNNKFAGWTFGELQIIDSIESLFNGTRKSFPIKVDNELRSIRAKYGSPIDIKSTLLVFINGILQIPGEGYTFTGSSFITFAEAPKENYSCVVLFYRGNGSTDVVDVDVLETVKAGDIVKLNDDFGYAENKRIVSSINSSDSVNTISYSGPGVSDDETYTRPVKWCRQTEDLFINQKEVTKNREIYEPIIEPSTNIIRTVGVTSTIIFVESVRTFFDDQRENALLDYRNKFKIVSQDDVRPAIATAIVSTAGTVRSVVISDGGQGYASSPVVSFSTPIGLTTASRAYANATVSAGFISSITVTSPGIGYTATLPPQVMISNPVNVFENITANTLEGDFGIITGIETTSVGFASTGLVFNLYIPFESALRNGSIAGAAITVSGIQTGYYFVVKNSFVGNGITSLDETNAVISTGTSFIDNVYRVANVSIGQSFVAGIGTTTVSRVTVSVVRNNNVTGIGFTNIYGTYSWGRITITSRSTSNQFAVYDNGITGVNTSPIVKRINPLKYKNYT